LPRVSHYDRVSTQSLFSILRSPLKKKGIAKPRSCVFLEENTRFCPSSIARWRAGKACVVFPRLCAVDRWDPLCVLLFQFWNSRRLASLFPISLRSHLLSPEESSPFHFSALELLVGDCLPLPPCVGCRCCIGGSGVSSFRSEWSSSRTPFAGEL